MSRIIKLIVLLSVSVLLSFSSSEANWWKNQKLSKEMQLKKNDIESFEKILSENRKEVLELRGEFKKLNNKLMQTLKDDKISKEKRLLEVNKTVKKIATISSDMVLKNYSSKTKILSSLTEKQLNILTAKFPRIMQRGWMAREAKRQKRIKGKVPVKE